ncbi:integrase core domain-containing protein [Paraburkholderia bonniea]|uniref:integrase core domain-containing protein n=1 Tax=Paraburkholderia bonniea TaxID=2152891 RepID=UPI003CCDBEFB
MQAECTAQGKAYPRARRGAVRDDSKNELHPASGFRSRAEAKVVIEQWRCHSNAIRPHSSLAYLTPDEFKQRHCSTEATKAVLQD